MTLTGPRVTDVLIRGILRGKTFARSPYNKDTICNPKWCYLECNKRLTEYKDKHTI